MEHTKLSIKQLRELIKDGGAADPIVFLEAVSTGQDPRRTSRALETALEIKDMCGTDIGEEDFNELLEVLEAELKYKPVSLGDSINAAKTLAEYLHPKRKSLDVTNAAAQITRNNTPLASDEVETFLDIFNEQF